MLFNFGKVGKQVYGRFLKREIFTIGNKLDTCLGEGKLHRAMSYSPLECLTKKEKILTSHAHQFSASLPPPISYTNTPHQTCKSTEPMFPPIPDSQLTGKCHSPLRVCRLFLLLQSFEKLLMCSGHTLLLA